MDAVAVDDRAIRIMPRDLRRIGTSARRDRHAAVAFSTVLFRAGDRRSAPPLEVAAKVAWRATFDLRWSGRMRLTNDGRTAVA